LEGIAAFVLEHFFLAHWAFEGAWEILALPLPLVDGAALKGGTLVASCEPANGAVAAIVWPAEASMWSNRSSRESSLLASHASTDARSLDVGVEAIIVSNTDENLIKY
jgi:hypothetical protein